MERAIVLHSGWVNQLWLTSTAIECEQLYVISHWIWIGGDKRRNRTMCEGTLISRNYVITTAYCLQSPSLERLSARLWVLRRGTLIHSPLSVITHVLNVWNSDFISGVKWTNTNHFWCFELISQNLCPCRRWGSQFEVLHRRTRCKNTGARSIRWRFIQTTK